MYALARFTCQMSKVPSVTTYPWESRARLQSNSCRKQPCSNSTKWLSLLTRCLWICPALLSCDTRCYKRSISIASTNWLKLSFVVPFNCARRNIVLFKNVLDELQVIAELREDNHSRGGCIREQFLQIDHEISQLCAALLYQLFL